MKFFFEKFHRFLTSKIDFESTILALFVKLSFIDKIKKKSFEYIDSWLKMKFFKKIPTRFNGSL